jgi:hypothetical protein
MTQTLYAHMNKKKTNQKTTTTTTKREPPFNRIRKIKGKTHQCFILNLA